MEISENGATMSSDWWCKNFKAQGKGAKFNLPNDKNLRQKWLHFIDRDGLKSTSDIYVREFHFEERFLIRKKDSISTEV